MTTATHQLQNTWVVWEHKQLQPGATDWSTAMRDVCEFSTVEDFWKNWSFIPRPSDVFFDGNARREIEGRTIDGFSVFKKGIRPEWEDIANKTGSELTCRKTMQVDVLDAHWENMVLALIGETLEENDEICGCRVVDKSKKGTTRCVFRLELWLRTSAEDIGQRVRGRLLDALTEGEGSKPNSNKSKFPEFEFKTRTSL